MAEQEKAKNPHLLYAADFKTKLEIQFEGNWRASEKQTVGEYAGPGKVMEFKDADFIVVVLAGDEVLIINKHEIRGMHLDRKENEDVK